MVARLARLARFAALVCGSAALRAVPIIHGRTAVTQRRNLVLAAPMVALFLSNAASPAHAEKGKASDGKWARRFEPFEDSEFEDFQTSLSGLQYKVVEEGWGVKPTAGQNIKAHYAGYLTNGAKFDASYDRGSPLAFSVGAGRVIKGWDEALLDMKVGEKRILR
jgi:FKBP-type peptidyl-prolyl cis-trans isomerase